MKCETSKILEVIAQEDGRTTPGNKQCLLKELYILTGTETFAREPEV